MTEDTTAQLREQIETDAIRAIAFHPHCKEVCENYDGTQEPCYPCGAIFRLCDALDEARAQVEAAKATARREGLERGWDEGYDAPREKRWLGPSGSNAYISSPLPRHNPYREATP